MNDGFDDYVFELEEFDGKLIAGGKFDASGAIELHNIAQWDGVSWSHVGHGVGYHVEALFGYQDNLYVGGQFTQAGDVPCNRIARWDGITWHALGSGLNSYPKTMADYRGGIYIGGLFTRAGGYLSNKIGLWFPFEPTSVQDPFAAVPAGLLPPFPNPFNPRTTISFHLEATQKVRLTVCDLAGRELVVLVDREFSSGRHELVWNGRDSQGRELASGVYFLRLEAGEFRDSEKVVLLR